MIDLIRVFKYAQQTELTIEEHCLLYTVYIRTENPDQTDLLELANWYYNRFQFYDRSQQPTGISWSQMVEKLVRDGFLDTFPGYSRQARNGNAEIDMRKLATTQKFKDTIIDDDREKWWEMFLNIYGTSFWLGKENKSVSTLNTPRGETLDDVKSQFWTRCGCGSKYHIGLFFENVEDYVTYFGNNMLISNFLRQYDGLMISLSARRAAENTSSISTLI